MISRWKYIWNDQASTPYLGHQMDTACSKLLAVDSSTKRFEAKVLGYLG